MLESARPPTLYTGGGPLPLLSSKVKKENVSV